MFVVTEPIDAYRQLVKDGDIHTDPAQAMAIQKLQSLHEKLDEYGQQMGKTGWRARLTFRGKKKNPPQGLYMWGGVGRGKTMLMDLFFEHTNVDEKQHVHFHAFMQEVHRRVHAFRESQKAGKVSSKKDPLQALAQVIAERAWLLCFDEFHVTDIADAMILGRLFEELFAQGVVVVATSNRHPKDLYKDGLQRERFVPFIGMFMDKMEVMELASERDYRLERMQEMDVYMHPNSAETDHKLEEAFHTLTIGAEPKPHTLEVNGRVLEVPMAAEGVAFTTFHDLCEKPLGAADYLCLADRFHTLLLSGIPELGPERRNEAKRFVTLIDALYEAKTNLICAADTPPETLYTKGDGAFEFERTVSRLMEMQSPDYIALPHNSP